MSTAADTLRHDVKVIGLVAIAHGLSHFFQIATAVLFPLIKGDLDVSYTALGATVGLYYAVSGVCQTLAGFAVDRAVSVPLVSSTDAVAEITVKLATGEMPLPDCL